MTEHDTKGQNGSDPAPSGGGPVDFTKTRLFATIDLAGKSLSALALVILGVAGWLLQLQSQKARESTEAFERQERRYLPMLRSLSLLETKLEEIDNELRNHPDRDENVVYEVGTDLRFVAASVFEPEGDPLVSLRKADGPSTRDEKIQIPLKATTLMYPEMFRIRYFLKGRPRNAITRLDSNNNTVELFSDGAPSFTVTVHVLPESVPAWKVWLGSRSVNADTFRNFPNSVALQDLRFAIGGVIQQVLSKHADLGDRYVQIRDEIEKSRRSAETNYARPDTRADSGK